MANLKKKHAFSLVELMIVVAVTSVLVSLVMPMYKAEKDRAMGNQCLGNLKVIGRAMMLYCNDWDERFPYANEWTPGPTSLPGVLNVYVRSDLKPQVWRCPADIGQAASGGSPIPYWKSYETSYGYPGPNYKANGWPYLAGLKLSNPVPVPMPTSYSWIWQLPVSKRLMVYDLNCFHRVQGHSADWTLAEGRSNVVFCDGHVGTLGFQRFLNLLWGASEMK